MHAVKMIHKYTTLTPAKNDRIPYFRVDVLDELADSLILNKEVVTAGDVLHDVSLDHLVLKHGNPVVDQDGGRGRLKVGPEKE